MTTYQHRRRRQSEVFMNYTMSRPFTNWASALLKPFVICAVLLLHSTARATEALPSEHITDILRAAQSATSAEVFIVADTLSSIRPITQEQIPRYGCRYQVAERGMRDLLAIINQADLKHVAPHFMPPDLRILIRLNQDGGGQTIVAFMKLLWPNEDRLYGSVNGISASASAQFPENLQRWASGLTPIAPNKFTICP